MEARPEDIDELIATLPEKMGLEFDKNENHDLVIRKLLLEQVVAWNEEKDRIHIVSTATRLGADYFYNYLEQTYFTPCTPANDEYRWAIFKWNSLLWAIGSLPANKKHFAEKAAEEAQMKLANGIPFVIGPGKINVVAATRPEILKNLPENLRDLEEAIQWFPLCSDSTYTLENISGSAMYDGPAARQDLSIEYNLKFKKLYDSMGLS